MTEGELEQLGLLARSGDADAAILLIEGARPVVEAVAPRISEGVIEPDDLVSAAIERLLRVWRQGGGPSSNVSAYLIQTMKNLVVDEMRTGRMREVSLDGHPEPVVEDRDLANTELYKERAWVRDALQRLPWEQRHLLVEVHAHGRKPGVVGAEMGKKSSTVWSLHRRSKTSLKRALLQVILSESGRKDCVAAADELPEIVTPEYENSRPKAAVRKHIAGCAHCQKAWKRFGAITSTLGVGGLFTVSFGSADSAHALAADVLGTPTVGNLGSEHTAGTSVRGNALTDAGSKSTPDSGTGSTGYAANIDPSPDVAPVTMGSRTGQDNILADESRLLGRLRFGTIGAIAGTIFGICAGVLLCHSTMPPTSIPPIGSLDFVVEHSSGYRVQITFGSDRPDWELKRFQLAHASSVSLVQSPDGWVCNDTDNVLECRQLRHQNIDVQFEFSGTPIPGDEIHLELDVLVDGHLFSGHASSEFPRTGERLITRSEVRARDAAKVEQEMAIRASDLVESRSAATVEPARAVCSRSEYRGEQ